MIVYKKYDQQQLDHQYNKRAEVPDFQVYVRDWKERSEQTRQRRDLRSNLRYGNGPREVLDFFPAPGGGPLMVFFHGGYWQAMDKSAFHFLVEGFLPHGISCAIVNYPLAPSATLDDMVTCCRRSLVWLARRGATLGFDPESIHVSGHSAGGHLTAMLLATSGQLLEDLDTETPGAGPLPPRLIHSACALSGLFDLEPVRLTYLNAVLGLDEPQARRNSPIHLQPAVPAPLVVGVGGDESIEFLAQSEDFATAWRRHGLQIEEWAPDGANHFNILDDFCRPQGAIHRSVLGLLGIEVQGDAEATGLSAEA